MTDPARKRGGNTPPPLLTVDVDRRTDTTSVVSPVGEVDMLTAPLFEERINGAFAAPAERVVVDLTGLTFFGSAGAAVLVKTAAAATERGDELRVVVGESVAARVLEVSGLLDVLAGYDTVELALLD